MRFAVGLKDQPFARRGRLAPGRSAILDPAAESLSETERAEGCFRSAAANTDAEGVMAKTGWDASADAWIVEQGEAGDYGRRHVLDGPMLARVDAGGFRRALDVGCGEGRFCRMLRTRGIETVGVDPTPRLLQEARRRDPGGDYHDGRAEALAVEDGAFDLVVSYLSLIDIDDHVAAIGEMARALRPGGALLIANLHSFNTAGQPRGWAPGATGAPSFEIDDYLEPRPITSAWRGIRVVNHHRPLQAYLAPLIDAGLTLSHFEEPAPTGGDPDRAARYRRVPYFLVMEWRKGANGDKGPLKRLATD